MSFETNRSGALLWHTSTLFDAGAVCHGFSTRPGGVSPAPWDSLNLGVGRGDTAENVQENFRRFCAAVGTDPMRVVLSKQVHEPNVRLVTGADAGKGLWRERDYQSVDAMICNTPNLPLVVFSADCGIILLHDPVHAAVGAVHAGWRGAAQGLVSIALRRMGEVFGTHPADVRAAIGAGIGPCCFETDGDVPQAMRAAPSRISSSAARSGMSISRASTPTGSARTAWSKSTSARTARPAARICTGPIAGWATRAARRSP